MSDEEKTIADRAFRWVMCARRPLKTKEILPAISQNENNNTLEPVDDLTEDIVLKCCHNLLVIDPIREVWIPSHLSVIEYFEDHLWTQSQANCLVASVCLIFLQNAAFYDRQHKWWSLSAASDAFGDNPDEDSVAILADYSKSLLSGFLIDGDTVLEEENDPKDPLSGQGFEYLSFYVTNIWPFHAQKSASNGNNNSRLAALVEEFLGQPKNSSAAYRCWYAMVFSDYHLPLHARDSSIFNSSEPLRLQDLAPLSIASFGYCAFELNILIPEWYNFNWIKDDNRNTFGQTFLQLAARSGSISTCRFLIIHGAETNAQTRSTEGSALAAAANYGKKEVVEFLVKEGGADVNMQLQYGTYGSALAAAAYHGKKEVVEFLVKEGGADVNLELISGNYSSALEAAELGHDRVKIQIVQFLIEHGAKRKESPSETVEEEEMDEEDMRDKVDVEEAAE